MENSRNLFSTGKNQNTKQNIDNRRLNLTTFEAWAEMPLPTRLCKPLQASPANQSLQKSCFFAGALVLIWTVRLNIKVRLNFYLTTFC
jgi:hypothetical protein